MTYLTPPNRCLRKEVFRTVPHKPSLPNPGFSFPFLPQKLLSLLTRNSIFLPLNVPTFCKKDRLRLTDFLPQCPFTFVPFSSQGHPSPQFHKQPPQNSLSTTLRKSITETLWSRCLPSEGGQRSLPRTVPVPSLLPSILPSPMFLTSSATSRKD